MCSCLSPQPITACGGKVEISCEGHREVKESMRYCRGSARHGWRLVGVKERSLGGLFCSLHGNMEPNRARIKLAEEQTGEGGEPGCSSTMLQEGGQVELLGSSSTTTASVRGPAPATSVFPEPCMTDNALVGSSQQHGDSFRGSDGRDRPRLPLG